MSNPTQESVAEQHSAAGRKDALTGHQYDGIQEYDNPTPGWWTWVFVLSIFFAFTYYFVVNIIGGGQFGPVASLEIEQAELARKQFGELLNETPDAPTLVRLMNTEKWQKAGAYTFAAKCVACHGRDANGLTGPNLTDDYYINVQKIEDIFDVIQNGRNNGAMPAWGRMNMKREEIMVVASYVAGLRGKNLPGKPVESNAKVAPPWPAYVPTTRPVALK